MKKQILAVCDMEVTYAYNFMEYLSQKKNIPFHIQAFTTVDHVCKFARNNKIELLLISDKAMNEEISSLDIGKIVILTESECMEVQDGFASVYKYQSSENVIREVMSYYTNEEVVATLSPINKGKTKIIGVYSPLGRTLKTSFCLVMGQLLAKRQGVLYINLEEYSGFEELFHIHYEETLSDLIFYLNEKKEHVIFKLGGMVHSLNQLDYIPPCESPTDVHQIDSLQWKQLLQIVKLHSKYRIIILDIGDGVKELTNVMNVCDHLYMPVLEDSISKAKIKQFENLLRMMDCIPILERVKKLVLPSSKGDTRGESYLEKLLWGELGDYTKKLLMEEQMI